MILKIHNLKNEIGIKDQKVIKQVRDLRSMEANKIHGLSACMLLDKLKSIHSLSLCTL